ncbi:MAG: AsmA family protein [Candidatus Omnitrophota bacterium]
MRIRRKILRNGIILVVLITVSSTWYINKFLAPRILKDLFLKNISQTIDRPVTLGSVRFNLFHGFRLNNLTIYEHDKEQVFIHIKSVSTSLLFIPFLPEKRIFIPSVFIDSPTVTFIKRPDNTWNAATPPFIKHDSSTRRKRTPGFTVLVQKIKINNATVNFEDNSRTPAFADRLIGLDGEIMLSAARDVEFKTTAHLDSPEKTFIALAGFYAMKQRILLVKGTVKNLSLPRPYAYFFKTGGPLAVRSAFADGAFSLKVLNNGIFSVDLHAALSELLVQRSHYTLKGAADIDGVATIRPQDTLEGKYRFQIDLKDAALSGVPLLNDVSNINGKINLSDAGVSSECLWAEAYRTPIKFSGQIDDFKTLRLRCRAQADMDLAEYKNFLPKHIKKKFEDIGLKGPAEVTISYASNLKDPHPGRIEGDIRLKGATLTMPQLPGAVDAITGAVSFENNIFYFLRVAFNYAGRSNTLDAKVTDLSAPEVLLKFRNNELALNTRFKTGPDMVHVLRMSGTYRHSPFNVAGTVTNFRDPVIDANGRALVNLTDLRKIPSPLTASLEHYDVKGEADVGFYARGPVKRPRDMEFALKGAADRITVANLKLDAMSLDMKLKEGLFTVNEFNAKPYGGTFDSRMKVDLTQKNPPYKIELALEGIDLSKLALDTSLRDKPIKGTGRAKLALRGYGKNAETVKGEGSLMIRGAYLWSVPLLKGIADLFFLHNLSKIVFDEVSTTFTITNKSISTADLLLHSKSINLFGEGGANFDGALDLELTTSVSEEFVRGNSELSKITNSLLFEAGQFIGNVKISGTVKKPAYRFIPLPIGRIIKDKLSVLFGKILPAS